MIFHHIPRRQSQTSVLNGSVSHASVLEVRQKLSNRNGMLGVFAATS
jgi:hypothetical protein